MIKRGWGDCRQSRGLLTHATQTSRSQPIQRWPARPQRTRGWRASPGQTLQAQGAGAGAAGMAVKGAAAAAGAALAANLGVCAVWRTFQAIQAHHKSCQVCGHQKHNVAGGRNSTQVTKNCRATFQGLVVGRWHSEVHVCMQSYRKPVVWRQLSNWADRAQVLTAISGKRARQTSQAQLTSRHCGQGCGMGGARIAL